MIIDFSNYRPTFLIPIIGLLWMAYSYALSYIWGYGFFQGLGPTYLVLATLCAYDKWLWRYPVLKLLVRTPDIAGRYEGIVKFDRDGIDKTKDCILEIRQTASFTTLTYFFQNDVERDTTSKSKECFFKYDNTGFCNLLYYYQNEGSGMYEDSLGAHEGFCNLDIIKGKTGMELKGFYFTNRKTKGRLEVFQVINNKEGKHEHA